MMSLIYVMLPVIVWCAGVLLLFFKLKKRNLKKRLKWSVTSGKVTYAKIKHHKKKFVRDGPIDECWSIWIEYLFQVAGKNYSAQQDWAQKTHPDEYAVGSNVTLYYNPVRPGQAVVNRDKLGGFWTGNGILFTAFLLPILFLIFVILTVGGTP